MTKITNAEELYQAEQRYESLCTQQKRTPEEREEMSNLSSSIASYRTDRRYKSQVESVGRSIAESVGRGSDHAGRGAVPFSSGAGSSEPLQNRVRVLPSSPEQQQHDLGVYLQCVLVQQVDHLSPQQTLELAANHFGNDRVSSAMQANTRAHTSL